MRGKSRTFLSKLRIGVSVMKAIRTLLVSLTALFFLIGGKTVAADISVYVDGDLVESEVPAQIINDRTMLPMRAVFEKLGAAVEWDADYQIVTAVKGSIILNLRIDKPAMVKVNLQTQEVLQIMMDVPAQIVQDRTMVPVRAAAEALEAEVDWDEENRAVKISLQEE